VPFKEPQEKQRGCGSGRSLRALRKVGLQAVGVEVSEILVARLRQNGLQAIKGLAPDFPWDDSQPFAITFFEVLEHIPNLMEVIEPLKKRFPKACILASVPSPFRAGLLLYRQRNLSDFPPNHFLRWTPKALEIFFEKVGYSKVTIELPAPIGSELMPGLGQLMTKFIDFHHFAPQESLPSDTRISKFASASEKARATAILWAHKGYQVLMDLLGFPKAWAACRRGASAASMLVIAEP